MSMSMMRPAALFRRRGGDRHRRLTIAREAQVPSDRALELGARNPVLRERLDVAASGVDLVALRLQELVDAREHRVVLALGLLDDLPAQREEHLGVVLCSTPSGLHPRPCPAHLRAYLDGDRAVALEALPELGRRGPDPRLTLVEDRDRELDRGADRPLAFRLALGLRPDDRRRHETLHAGQA